MLKLQNIVKIYDPNKNDIKALDEVSIDFRESEFVSILGPSGCGKTTMLNVIGGLDSYTSGDLYINGKSTKDFKDRDWDNYRNHSIGFVFQSYNLIPHQTILKNVELALTLSGINSKERKARAMEALKMVGLDSRYNKKPNQLSGGQMQRVAIARALVNNPSILLADEPTGALDTNTSLQIMEILKKVSEDRLVIMVTHNPELAENYSTRIIKIIDGKVVDDSNPFSFDYEQDKEELITDKKEKKALKKQKRREHKSNSMSFFTALSLSFNNMITKKARTILTAFAGSIGIIGIALILSLSSGFKEYINKIERNTLSTYPLTVQEMNMDSSALLSAVMDDGTTKMDDYKEDEIKSYNVLGNVVDSIVKSAKTNDLKSFKEYIDTNKEKFDQYGIVTYGYSSQLMIYPNTPNEKIDLEADTVYPYNFTDHLTGKYALFKKSLEGINNLYKSVDVWNELLSNNGDYSLVKSQYDLVTGCWPDEANNANSKYTNIVLRVNENNTIPDYVFYSLGLVEANELAETILTSMTPGAEAKPQESKVFKLDELMNLEFKCIVKTDTYEYENGLYKVIEDQNTLKAVYDTSLTLRVCGIIKEKPNAKAAAMTGYVGYMSELNNYVIDRTNASNIVIAQKQNEALAEKSEDVINVLTGEKFAGTDTLASLYLDLGVVDYAKPSTINFYPSSFENKEEIINLIDEYNSQFENDNDKISYTDYVGILMSSISTIVNAITYVLIAFVAISLIVSSIMIGIITYISVLERTKEIGILRAIGASKKDISRVFNAETIILGLFSGLIGVVVTVILNIPINIIIDKLANIGSVAALPVWGAAGLILISVCLTLIAGIIPSRFASKKDPVVALRTE